MKEIKVKNELCNTPTNLKFTVILTYFQIQKTKKLNFYTPSNVMTQEISSIFNFHAATINQAAEITPTRIVPNQHRNEYIQIQLNLYRGLLVGDMRSIRNFCSLLK